MQGLFQFRVFALAMLVAATPMASASDDCDVPTASWKPRDAVLAWAQQNGWQVDRLKIDDGCYEIQGRDAQGGRIRAKLDPATLQVVRIKRGHGGQEHDRSRQRGAGPSASPAGSAPP